MIVHQTIHAVSVAQDWGTTTAEVWEKPSDLSQHIFSGGFQQVLFFMELLKVQDGGSRGRLTKEKGGGGRPGSCSFQGFDGMGFHQVSGLDVWDNWAKTVVKEEKGANFYRRKVRDASHCVNVCQIRPSHILSLETAPIQWTSPLSIWENCVQMDVKWSDAENRDPFPMSLNIVWYNCESANGTLFFWSFSFSCYSSSYCLLFPSLCSSHCSGHRSQKS